MKSKMDSLETKKPAEIMREIVAFLEEKGIDKETIKQFLDELEKALKAELVAKIIESVPREKYQSISNDLGENPSEEEILRYLGLSEEKTEEMLSSILSQYKKDIVATVF